MKEKNEKKWVMSSYEIKGDDLFKIYLLQKEQLIHFKI